VQEDARHIKALGHEQAETLKKKASEKLDCAVQEILRAILPTSLPSEEERL